MPLPIGHALAGIAFHETRPGLFFRNRWHDAVFFMFLANLPDGDFLPGFLVGFPNRFHHGVFHSLGAALAVSMVIGWLFSRQQGQALKYSAFAFVVFYSHLLLDFFTLDFTPPFGLPLFWPFSGHYHIAAHPVFINITRSPYSANFFSSLFSLHNLKAALLEIVLLGGVVMLAACIRRFANNRSGRAAAR
jgi:inner membrane protein